MIHVDFSKCTGLGICESLAPDFFEIGDDGKLALLRTDLGGVTGGDLEGVEQAVRSCPTAALRISKGVAT
ncbi:ferredoxin [Kitasatospora sp. NPDC059327]|uniref:ferredoxin n=1 Tax=Kitasatospora sp. NPDC059327 TaxID=3346803 RepID=UPI0036ACF2AA